MTAIINGERLGHEAVRPGSRQTFRLGEDDYPQAKVESRVRILDGDPLNGCSDWASCSPRSARQQVHTAGSWEEGTEDDQIHPQLDEDAAAQSLAARTPIPAVRLQSSPSDISQFAMFASRHLGGVLLELASQYESGCIRTPQYRQRSDGTSSDLFPRSQSAQSSDTGDMPDNAPWGKEAYYSLAMQSVDSCRALRTRGRTMSAVQEGSTSSSDIQRPQDVEEIGSSSSSDDLELGRGASAEAGTVQAAGSADITEVPSDDVRPGNLSPSQRKAIDKLHWQRDVSAAAMSTPGDLDSLTGSQTQSVFFSHRRLANGALPDWVKKSLRRHQTKSLDGDASWYNPRRLWNDFSFRPKRSFTERSVRRAARKQARQGIPWRSWLTTLLITVNTFFVLTQLHSMVNRECPSFLQETLSLVFSGLFTMELLWRFLSFGPCSRSFIANIRKEGWWILFDSSVLLILWCQQVLRHVLDGCPTRIAWDVSILRMFRVCVSLHTLSTTSHSLREIRLLSQVMNVAIRSWLLIVFITSCFIYLCSIVVSHGAYPLCHSQQEDLEPSASRQKLCNHFSTFGATFLSLYKAIFGGVLWGDIVEAMEEAPVFYQAVVLSFISFGVVVIANLTTGILIEARADGDGAKKNDIQYMMAMEERETSLFLEAMKGIFTEIDANHSGAISKEEMELALEEPQMNALLRCFKLEVHDAQLLFDLLDIDNSDSIDMEEFIGGCLRMKGNAQAIDITRLQMQMHDIHQAITAGVDVSRLDSIPEKENHGFRGMGRATSDWNRQTSGASTMSQFSPALTSLSSASTPGSMSPALSLGTPTLPHLQPLGSMKTSGEELRSPGSPGHVPSLLASSMPSWSGSRIPKVEERAMMLQEFKTLRSQIKLHMASWQAERTCRALRASKVNMYDVNYNWICPLTLPEGVILEGLHLRADIQLGTPVSQAPKPGNTAPRAIGEVMAVTPDGRLKVKVFRGQFTDGIWGDAPVTLAGRESCGTPTRVSSPLGMSYKELVSANGAKPDWYCCHWWGEPILDFILCLEEHTELRNGSGTSAFWVCAFANDQHDLGAELADDPEKSSFRRAMSLAVGVLLVLDKAATPFQRIWCDYELYKTLLDESKMLDIVTVSERRGRKKAEVLAELPGESAVKKTMREASFPIGVLAKGIRARLEDGQATVMTDKERILHYMRKEVELSTFNQAISVRSGAASPAVSSPLEKSGLEAANYTLNAFFAWAAWPQALKQGMVSAFGSRSRPETLVALPSVTSRDVLRGSLTLSLAHFSEVNDQAIQDLSRGLPTHLRELSLSFEGCSHISDVGLQHLCFGMQKLTQLQRLSLDFLGCKRISDIGLDQLSRHLPRSLVKLRLDFAKCSAIGARGLASLAANLPQGVREFSGTFKGTAIDRNFESIDQLRRAAKDATPQGRSVPALSYALFGANQ